MIRPLLRLGAVTSILACACSDEGPRVVASLEFSPATADVPLGGSRQLHVTARDAQSQPINFPTFEFTSSNPAVAIVSSGGVVTGISPGFDTITATSASVTATAEIAVVTHPNGTATGASPVASRPFGIAIAGSDLTYVGRQDLPYLQLTHLPDSSFSDSIAVGSDPTDIAFTSSGLTAYVTNQGSGNLGIIDVVAKQSIDSIQMGAGSMYRVRVRRDDQYVYLSTSEGWVLEISTAARAVSRGWSLGGPANGLAFRPDGSILYATTTDGYLYEITLSTGRVRVESVGGTPQDVVVSLDAAELWVADESGDVLVLNAATGALITRVYGANDVFGLALSRDGTQLYGSIPFGGLVVIIDRATRKVVKTLTVDGIPRRIVFNRLGTKALIANESGYVSWVR